MIYDCSLFFNELDLLEIRLNELKDLDCKHVIVESCLTFQGNPKPFNLEASWDRFKEFHHKMIYLKLSPINNPMLSAWTRENFQRNYISVGLKEAEPNDIIYIGDIDEIPKKEIFSTFKPEYGVSVVETRLSYYYVNFVFKESWCKSQIMTMETLKMSSPNTIRYEHTPSVIKDGGWHFSYLGGVDSIIEKIESAAHTEFNNDSFKDKEKIKNCLRTGDDILNRAGVSFHRIPMDNSFPKYLVDNQEKFKHLISEEA